MRKTDKCHLGRIQEVILLFQHPIKLSHNTNSVNQQCQILKASLCSDWLVLLHFTEKGWSAHISKMTSF